MDILFGPDGTPKLINSTLFFGESKGRPSDYIKKRDILSPYDIEKTQTTDYGNYKVMNWGKDNKFPLEAAKSISTTSVLNTGLKFLRSLTIGQGIYPCKVVDYDSDGNEVLEGISDMKIHRFVNGRMVRRYLEKVSRDYFKFGNGAVQMFPNQSGTEIVGLNPLNEIGRAHV